MKTAADFRRIARNSLRGNWFIAMLTGFVASLMGARIATNVGRNSIRSKDFSDSFIQKFQTSDFGMRYRTLIITILIILIAWIVINIIISGAIQLGYAKFNLKLIDLNEMSFFDLFSQFHRLGDGFFMNFLVNTYIFLWSLLLIIPGIIKQYSYAMTPYILTENLNLTASEAISKSRQIMNGNKWRLFCLGFSFIGWKLLCMAPTYIVIACAIGSGEITTLLWLIPCYIPYFIGTLFLNPYQEAAYAAFYRDITACQEELITIIEDKKNECETAELTCTKISTNFNMTNS